MEQELTTNLLRTAKYALKEGTKTSYLRTGGTTILPKTINISRGTELSEVAKKGRNNIHPFIGQMIGKFTKVEASPYKQHKPYVCRTQIWQLPEYPLFIGYGTAGITKEGGKGIKDTGDLLIFHSSDSWQTITIFHFAGMGNPDSLLDAFEVATKEIRKD